MTKYATSPWLAEFPKSRVPASPVYRGPADADVVIVGGGLVGCATAYGLAMAGMKTVLLEADRIGCGATAHSTGWIDPEPGVPFAALESQIGVRQARRGWQAWRRASLDFAALLRRLEIKCRLEPRESVIAATTAEQAARVKKDHKALAAAGFDAVLLNARTAKTATGLDVTAAIRHRDGAVFDPYRACVGLATAAVSRGASLFERSAVRRVTFTRKDAQVHTADGVVRTRRVVIATGVPTVLHQPLVRHFWLHQRYAVLTEPVPSKARPAGGPAIVLRDLADPPHLVRWDDEHRVMVSGGDGPVIPARQVDKTIVQRTGQLMYELSTLYPEISGVQPAYGWSMPYARTVDGLPYIGPHRNFPHQLFAFGDASHGLTGAYLASRILLRQCSGEMDPADETFGFHR